MEFNEKLQELRRSRGLTQEDLARALYVSRAAVSKWESGRGYPSTDSLKALAKHFSVSIDELLSDDEILPGTGKILGREDMRHKNTIFALLDLSTLLLLFLPFFAQHSMGTIQSLALLSLNEIPVYLKLAYLLFIAAAVILAITSLVLRKNAHMVSMLLGTAGLLLFIISRQPYAAIFLLIELLIKVLMLIKSR